MTTTKPGKIVENVPVTYEWMRDNANIAYHVFWKGTKREYFSAICPFHDDTSPSLMVYPVDPWRKGEHDGWWRCLAGCGVGGLDSLHRKLGGWEHSKVAKSRKKAPHGLEWHPPTLPTDEEGLGKKVETAHAILLRYPELGWYIEQRGLKERIELRLLGYLNGWISIPAYTAEGTLKTVVLRSTPPVQEATGVRFHSPALPPALYVPNWSLVAKAKQVYVVFGMFDALSLDEISLPVVCSTHGNQSLSPDWFMGDVLRGKHYLLVSDSPTHEMAEVKERCLMMQHRGLKAMMWNIPYPNGCKDANDILKFYGPEELRKRLTGGVL